MAYASLETHYEEILNSLASVQKGREARLNEIIAEIARQQEVQRYAVKQGDLSENAEYKESTEALQELAADKAYVEECIDIYNNFVAIQHYTDSAPEDRYIDLKSVVRLEYDGKESVYMLVPGGLSNIEKGALSERCPVGLELLGKKSGTTIHINVKGKNLRYHIKEVY